MRLIVCDRCRQEINGVPKTGYINLDKRDIETGELEGNENLKQMQIALLGHIAVSLAVIADKMSEYKAEGETE